jgi:hypothetical protein
MIAGDSSGEQMRWIVKGEHFMRKAMQRTALFAGAVALSAIGFSGTALAWHHHADGDGGNGGSGGNANANCLIPVGVSAGVIGQGGDNSQCNAVAGSGGHGGNGIG